MKLTVNTILAGTMLVMGGFVVGFGVAILTRPVIADERLLESSLHVRPDVYADELDNLQPASVPHDTGNPFKIEEL